VKLVILVVTVVVVIIVKGILSMLMTIYLLKCSGIRWLHLEMFSAIQV